MSDSAEAYFDALEGREAAVARALRALVREVGPSLTESLKWGQPVYAGARNVCYVAAEGDHVKLGFFRGAQLPDPTDLLEGTGKEMRHVKVRSVEDAQGDALQALAREAVALDRDGS